MKKESARLLVLILLASVILISITQFVSAQTAFDELIKDVANSISNLFQLTGADRNLFSSVLLGILLYIVLYSVIKNIFHFEGEYSWLSAGGVSLIVVILTFLYLPKNFTEAVVLQYGALGATILTIIPFVILLYFTTIVSKNLFIARTIWVFYAMYYFGLFAYKLAATPAGSKWYGAENIPYMAAIVAGAVLVIMMKLLRGKIFKEMLKSGEEKAMKGVKLRETLRKVENKEAQSYGIGGAGI